MKVVYLAPNVLPYTVARARELRRRNGSELVAFVHRAFFHESATVAGEDGIHVLGSSLRGSGGRAALRRWAERLDQNRPDAVVFGGYSPRIMHRAATIARRRGIATVLACTSTLNDRPATFVRAFLRRRRIVRYDAFIVPGQRSREFLEFHGVPTDRIGIAGNPVDNQWFADRAAAARAAASTRGDATDEPGPWWEPYLLFVGRFIPEKNLPALIRGYAAVAEDAEPPPPLVLAGSGPLERDVRALANERLPPGRVRFPGYLSYRQTPAAIAGARLLLLPSVSESWGLVVNEALACGVPVLASARCGCVPDLLVGDPTAGLVLPSTDAMAIADGIRAALGERTDDSDAARDHRRTVADRMSVTRWADAVVEAADRAVSHG